MDIQTISTSPEIYNFIIHDTISAAPSDSPPPPPPVQVKKKRRRKPRVCKNKEEAETQRMTHITVERNRRKLMNEHLGVLRSLMPETYAQRGDQASIVGGAIEYIKELEHRLQSLQPQKLQTSETTVDNHILPFPQYTWSQILTNNGYTSKCKASVADIEVTLIQTHVNLRILSRRSHRQLYKLIHGLQALNLNILHLNLTTFDSLILYSINAKVEEGSHFTSADDIAAAVHHMLLRLFEQENASFSASASASL